MKWIGYIFSSVWRLWFLLVFLLVFICFIPSLLFFTAVKKNPIAVAKLAKYWSKLTLWFSLVFPVVIWEGKIEKNKCYIFCPNHVSTLDIPLIFATLPVPIQYIGKAELAKLPFFGYFFKNNSVIVDRKSRKDSYAAFLKAGERLKKGLSMCIFPEGGIPPAKIFLKKFKNGPFRLAIEQDLTIIPITIADNKTIFPAEYYKGRPGIVRLKIHNAINVKELKEKTIESLNTTVYNTIFEQLKNYEKEYNG
tara:strand:+ start:659 stop:1408 length:750 start_codon:yes stop_codon:yes gene_type:complete